MKTEPRTVNDYLWIAEDLSRMLPDERIPIVRHFIRTDLFFLLWYGCNRQDMVHQWLVDRCREVQEHPDGYLDLWAREHYKSTIITFGLTIQNILASHGDDPLPVWQGLEPTFGIFSHTRPIAKGFLRQIKREFESNGLLKLMFSDVIWENCQKEAPKWSEDDGLVLKRKSNPKESTIEAWGLVEGQPTGKHFDVMIYDDVVTLASVFSPDMMKKTVESWEMSINLGAGDKPKRRYIGTRYHFNDCYKTLMDRQAATPRIYAATDDGTPEGNPVLKSREKISELRRILGPYTFATQQLLNPVADERQGMRREWINYHDGVNASGLNVYIVVDPASAKKKSSDYTAMWVIGLGSDQNYYVLDVIRDRFNLLERTDTLFRLHRKFRPLGVGYERFGMMADIEHIKDRMGREAYHFTVTELGGNVPKYDRIRGLIPSLCEGRWYFPQELMRTTYDGRVIDVVDTYINEELLAFPVPMHDDMLDAQSRILDPKLNAVWPRIADENRHADRYAKRGQRQRGGSSWAV